MSMFAFSHIPSPPVPSNPNNGGFADIVVKCGRIYEYISPARLVTKLGRFLELHNI